jgi:hypothetical protein
MSIVVDEVTYSVPAVKTFRIPYHGECTHPYRRHKPGGVLESDMQMQTRVQADVLRRRQARDPPLSDRTTHID